MSGIFFDMMEINIVVSVIFLAVFLLSGRLRKRYGAGWLKLVWVLLAVRLLIPYNFSLLDQRLADSGRITERADAFYGKRAYENSKADLEGQAAGKADAAGQVYAAGDGVFPANGMPSEGQENLTGLSFDKTEAGEAKGTGIRAEDAVRMNWFFNGNNLAMVWLAGVGICVLLCMGGYLGFWFNCRKNLRPVTDIELRKQVLRWERKFNGRANIPVYQSWNAKSPMLTGLFWTKLILPAGKREWEQDELELVMAHELCHYRNKDLWLKLLMTAAWCVNWFNPLVWLLKKQFFYELELACDGHVLSGYDEQRREDYARMMLSFAGERKAESAFSTEFGESKKQMKRRIDYMLDEKAKKKGITGVILTCMLLLAMGLMISCGNKPEEGNLGGKDAVPGEAEGSGGQGEVTDHAPEEETAESEAENGVAQAIPYNPNNEYNEMIRYYGDDILISRKDGIYRLSEDGESEELLYANVYNLKRGMEIYQDFLYFCGSARRGEQEASTVYRMDLESYEVEDALALFSQVFEGLYNVTVYEGKLYAAAPDNIRIGFDLDENGEAVRMLDGQAEDFLYKEDNEYWQLNLKIWNNEVVFDSEEYWETVDQMNELYRNVIDAAACERMLNGDQIVLKYKDELLTSIYLKKADGEYEFLCDTISYPSLVTETGVYYFADESFDIWYVDYETKTQQKIWKKEGRKHWEVQLVNYDQNYVYFAASNRAGGDQKNGSIYESYIMRVPRWTEEKAEKVYRFDSYGNLGSMYRNSGIAGERMFFNEHETIILDPVANGMERENNGGLSEDAIAMEQCVEGFVQAYFHNDEETLKTYLSESFEGEAEFYPYPGQADQIEGHYISGLPEGELPEGVICYVSYEYSGDAETDAYRYLSMEMEKTEQGWKVLSYGLEG